MKQIKGNKYLVIGSLAAFIFLGAARFIKLPDILLGFCVGISIAMNILGLYTAKHDINKPKNVKRIFFRRLIKANE